MKKVALSLIAAMLLLALVCGSALAVGDITVKKAKAYADKELTQYVGTIPKYTCLTVRAYGSYADVTYNGKQVYIKPSTLTQGKYKDAYKATATLAKNAKMYKRPSKSSGYTVSSKARKVYLYGIKDGCVLFRTAKGNYGFTSIANLSNIKTR